MGACLQCKKPESECKCEGGFKVIYYLGIPRSNKELKDLKTFDEAKAGANKEIQNILRILKDE